jgi:cytochrome c oxidase subunit 2
MTRKLRPRQLVRAAWPALLLLAVSACGGNYPNSTFLPTTEFNRDVTKTWDTMILWGTIVFVIVEAILIAAIVRYRRRPDSPEPEHVHGNTAMEIAWTVLPLFILAIIAVPTVRNIWKYQGAAPDGALQVQVIGHQWWWEFRYPQYGNLTTANEVYLQEGRAVSFELRTVDVLHSFWIPALGGKRDLVNNRTNYIWFTPDSTGEQAFIGSCNEYCGSSHANMRFRAYTVSAANFESWARHQASNAVFPPPTPAAPAPTTSATAVPASNTGAPAQVAPATPPASTTSNSTGYEFPTDKLGAHIMPATPIPASLKFDESLLAQGDATRGLQLYSRSLCVGCHKVRGNPASLGIIGPDLTHIASRHTIGAGLFPNDPKHMAYWIKNSGAMKPGSKMQTVGVGEIDPALKRPVTAQLGGLTDDKIADIVAYLRTLK